MSGPSSSGAASSAAASTGITSYDGQDANSAFFVKDIEKLTGQSNFLRWRSTLKRCLDYEDSLSVTYEDLLSVTTNRQPEPDIDEE